MYNVLGAARVGGGDGVGGGLCRWPSSGGVNLIIEIKSCFKKLFKSAMFNSKLTTERHKWKRNIKFYNFHIACSYVC